MWFLVFIHRDRASTSIFETRACWNTLVDQVLVRVLLPCNPQSTDSSPSLRQIQDARNHVNQALLLLGSHDESYRFKTGAEVNKVCGLRVQGQGGVETSLLHPFATQLVSRVPLPDAAHGRGDAPADQSEEPPHHAGLHDAARTGHQRADGTRQKSCKLHTVYTRCTKQSAVKSEEKSFSF